MVNIKKETAGMRSAEEREGKGRTLPSSSRTRNLPSASPTTLPGTQSRSG